MDDLAVCENVLGVVLRTAAGRRVRSVRLRLGILHHGSQRDLNWTFALLAAGTVAADARLDVEITPVRACCRRCGFEIESPRAVDRCAACGARGLRLYGGDDLVVESVALDS